MNRKEFLCIFAAYLHKCGKSAGVYCVFIFLFVIVFFLYRTPLAPVGYAALLCAAIGLLIFCWELFRFARKHRQLEKLKIEAAAGAQKLPPAMDLLERDYQEMLDILYRDKARLLSEADAKSSDLATYYTMWTHQIKTPIAAMKLLLQSRDNPEDAALVQELFSIERYVEMALGYLRVDSLSGDLFLKEYAVLDMVRQAVKKYAVVFIHKGIRLELQEMDCMALTDEKWLVFVLEQLLSNALKYTKQGKISIYMHPEKEKTLVIEDTGIGIQSGDLPRVFERGFTGYNGRMDKKSTGLGLHLCKRILGKLSHKIEIFSQPEKGTRVELDLGRNMLPVD